MLDLNHPRTRIIFKAAGYTDRLKNYCGKYTVESFNDRQETFIQMSIICDEFEQFYNLNFATIQRDVKEIIDTIKAEIDHLSKINDQTEPENCKVCNSKLFVYKSLIKEFGTFYFCNKCSEIIVAKLNELESITGAVFI
ncbi:hypothetical protein H9Q08_15360 [Chryseobacterium sp. PS-8]|uniref:ClpX-type ZB domain-containing protein n=1 Tax=Chryseobacterium indicum TaxID=2766954 RepID=A0ABS9CAG1_9FLAO|nr:hypothetical protein [Chryseobacterium sp. PS-8]MCF2220664.1 hypothetical protein [Chryseobacterium sp. PS-8]